MPSADYTFVSDVASSADIRRAVTAGIPAPPGGGSFVYGMASQTNTPGVVALYYNGSGFAPLTKGGDIRAAMKRLPSAGDDLFSAWIFLGLPGTASTGVAYMLGLSNSEPSHIVLKKGALSTGLPDVVPGTLGVLRRSSATFTKDTWVHLRLEVVANVSGDVVLNAYQNDPNVNPVDAPIWTAIPGLTSFIDDALGINSGSVPIVGGRIGFGMNSSDVNRNVAFDEILPIKQN